MIDLIKKYKKRFLFLSGDVHYAEFMKHPCSHFQNGFEIYEFTSSGLSMDFNYNQIINDDFFNYFLAPETFNTH